MKHGCHQSAALLGPLLCVKQGAGCPGGYRFCAPRLGVVGQEGYRVWETLGSRAENGACPGLGGWRSLHRGGQPRRGAENAAASSSLTREQGLLVRRPGQNGGFLQEKAGAGTQGGEGLESRSKGLGFF